MPVWQALVGLNALDQRIEVSHSLGGSQAKFRRIAADGVGQLRTIADQPVTYADEHYRCLLLGCLHRHEPHRRPTHRLTKRFGVRRIVLATLDIRFDQLRCYQLHLMASTNETPIWYT